MLIIEQPERGVRQERAVAELAHFAGYADALARSDSVLKKRGMEPSDAALPRSVHDKCRNHRTVGGHAPLNAPKLAHDGRRLIQP
jgi:hypothetical protein